MLSLTNLTHIPDLICANPSLLRRIQTKALGCEISHIYTISNPVHEPSGVSTRDTPNY